MRLDWEPLRGHGLTTGVVRHACRHRVTARGVFGFEGGAVVVCSEGGCGSMCWPVDRPATHAAAGAAARGALIFCFGGFFHTLGSGWHERVRGGGLIRCAGRPREWSCGAVPPQERWHEGGWFLFFLWRLLRCRKGILSHARDRPATHAAAGAAARGALIFWFGGFFCGWTGGRCGSMC